MNASAAGRAASQTVEIGATALWVGASAGFAFVSAPIAFALVSDRNVFATLTERSLARLATLTYVAGGIAGASALGRAGFESVGRAGDVLRAVAAAGAVAAIAYHQRSIVPEMTRAQAEMGGFGEVAEDDPRRIAYRAMHQRSTRVYGTALLCGMLQLMLAATRAASNDAPAN